MNKFNELGAAAPVPLPIRTAFSMIEGADARILAREVGAAAARGQPWVHVAVDEARVQVLADLCAFFAPQIRVVVFPAWDCLPYDRVSPHADIVAARLAALATCLTLRGGVKEPTLILTTAAAATQRVIPPDILAAQHVIVTAGQSLDVPSFERFLVRHGYGRTDTVREAGEFAVRGGIIDVFPSGAVAPLRLDLFGDTVESLRAFDPATQRSGASVPSFTILPATEYGLDSDSIARFRGRYRDAFGVPRGDDPLYTAISEGRRYQGAEHWLPLFYDQMATFLDYVPGAPVSLDPQLDHGVAERAAQIADYYATRAAFVASAKKGDGHVYHPLPPTDLYVAADEWMRVLAERDVTQWVPFRAPDENQDIVTRAPDFAAHRQNPRADVMAAVVAHLRAVRATQKRVLLACYTPGSAARLIDMLNNAGFTALQMVESGAAMFDLPRDEVGVSVLPLEHGFTDTDLAVMTEQDILGDRLIRKAVKKKKSDHFINEIASLNPGDLVVHHDHGVGRFEGLETITAAGARHDCLKLTYDGGDRLYLPVENMDLITRFGADEGTTPLDKLGGVGWQARKARVKKDLMAMAGELLAIAAARQLRQGPVFDVRRDDYDRFVARFPYPETEDQLNAINDVLADLSAGVPADRLVCGDVGFGKTEVALRAAYVAARAGAQVAVVVPTTLLARQHTQNFTKRFEGTGLRIGQLSRMVNARDAALVKQGLKDGSIHIVIGTHALLAKDIAFSGLGLVIVDEEQRFGVKQKEALKALKNDVHVLTLTATPIPRTLQMALTGVREMSIIATPPVDRLAIRTFVMPYDGVVIREAILRERHRGGQTFYVCPRISDLQDVADKLRDLVPEVRVVLAHGQLAPTELEDRMGAFYDGQYDVLLATNIIESGIDIPTANTMIVHRADMFGLAQLYQIRGRIGRSKTRAYAYLTYDGLMKLNAQAQKRLEVIEMLDSLGGGFQLASHDMDIRGSGNLLGDDQSGHVREVGVELYQQMLQDAVAAARAQNDLAAPSIPEKWSPVINMGTSILIPETYVTDLTLRLGLYKRLTDLEEGGEIQGFAAELIDRFGPLPVEVANLLDLMEIKGMCRAAGVARVDAGPKGAVIEFKNNLPPNPGALLQWLHDKKGTVKLRPDQKLVAAREWSDLTHRVKGTRSLLGELAKLITPY